MFESLDWTPFLIVFFQFLQYHIFVVFFSNTFALFLTGTCIAMPSPQKKIAYKTVFALNMRLAITGLSLFLMAHVLLLTFLTGSK